MKAVNEFDEFVAKTWSRQTEASLGDALCDYLVTLKAHGKAQYAENMTVAEVKHLLPDVRMHKAARTMKSWK